MRPGDASVAIEATEFAKILEGLELARATTGIGIVHRKAATPEEIAPTR